MSPRLLAYLTLERGMLELDEHEDPLADKLRDAMDPLWYALTDEERRELDARDFRTLLGDRATPGMSGGVEFAASPPEPRPAPLIKAEPRSASGSNLEAA